MSRKPIAVLVAAIALVAAALAPVAAPASTRGIRIAAVGDIACKNRPGNNRQVCQYDDVASAIARGNYDRFLVLGDVQYEYGRYQDYVDNYDRYFGRFLPISEPVPGNHDYGTADAAGYYRYFGRIGQTPDGYYSYDLGSWHIVALNSAICPAATGCGPGDPQYQWLQADLAASDAECTLAYWHHPRWDWLHYQNADWTEDYEWLRSKPFWDLLSAAHADVVLLGPQPQLLALAADGCERQRRPERYPPVHRGQRRPQPERVRLQEHEAGHVPEGVGQRVRLPAAHASRRRLRLEVRARRGSAELRR